MSVTILWNVFLLVTSRTNLFSNVQIHLFINMEEYSNFQYLAYCNNYSINYYFNYLSPQRPLK